MNAARLLLAPAAALLAAGCADRTPVSAVEPPPRAPLARYECAARVREATLTCAPASGVASGARAIMIGGQDLYVKVGSSDVGYDSASRTFAADVTIRNLLPQAMGTADGGAADPEGVRVFFHTGPAVAAGAGEVWVSNPDGEATFTAARQPFFRYDGILAPGAASAAKRWEWHVDPGVTWSHFTLLVDARLAPALVINEIMAHPSTADEAAGEWIEIHNPGLEPVDLNGWTIASGGDGGHVVAGPLSIGRGAYLVLGGSTDPLANGGAPVARAYAGVSLGNDTGDWLALRSPAGMTVDSVAWGAAGGDAAPPPTGASLELASPAADNLHLGGTGSSWEPAGSAFGAGQWGTPGARNAVPLYATALSVGDVTACAVDHAGAVWCWGDNRSGELGAGAPEASARPVRVATPAGERIVDVTVAQLVNSRYGCALSTAGRVYCWGWGWFEYQFALTKHLPTLLPPAPGVQMTQLAERSPHPRICTLSGDGKAFCWRHPSGPPGPDTTVAAVPQPDSLRFAWIGSGTQHAGRLCGISAAGRPYCEGAGGFEPVPWPAGESIVSFSPGVAACGVSSTGQAYCWGVNYFGQLGNGTTTESPDPVAVAQPAGVSFVGISVGGGGTACAWTASGETWCWGDNFHGQQGDGTVGEFRTTPAPVILPAGTGFAEVSVGWYATCARALGRGRVYCWGQRARSDGTPGIQLVPAAVDH